MADYDVYESQARAEAYYRSQRMGPPTGPPGYEFEPPPDPYYMAPRKLNIFSFAIH